MFRRQWWARWLAAAVLAVAGVALVHGRGVGGAARAETRARGGLRQLGFVATGDASTRFEGDHALAWALERSRPGAAGLALARGEGAALRWRVGFSGGGEAVVSADGRLWSVRRPVPTDPGADLFPQQAKEVFSRTLAVVVQRPEAWRWERSQAWREAGHTWYRARYVETGGSFPAGWRRELEIEMAGSTPVAISKRVHPLGTDLGVTMGRIAELRRLRSAALVGFAVVAIAMVLAFIEALAYHEPLAIARGVGVGGGVALCGHLAGQPVETLAVTAVVSGAAVALLPTWAFLPRSRLAFGAPAGVLLAAGAMLAPYLVNGMGGWLPRTPALPAVASVAVLIATAWFPALAEEPVLRGAIPGLLGPVVGWWGGTFAGACLGALLHPLPGVPLAASLGVELLIQSGLIVVARAAGVGAAVIARGTLASLVLRPAFPAGLELDAAALAAVAVGVVLILVRKENE